MDMDVDHESEMNLSCKEFQALLLHEFRFDRKQRKQQKIYAVRWARTPSQFVQRNISSIDLRVVTSNSMIHDTGRPVEVEVDVLKQLIEEDSKLTRRCLAE